MQQMNQITSVIGFSSSDTARISVYVIIIYT